MHPADAMPRGMTIGRYEAMRILPGRQDLLRLAAGKRWKFADEPASRDRYTVLERPNSALLSVSSVFVAVPTGHSFIKTSSFHA